MRSLYEDNQQNLLVGCIDGLMWYDRETDTFLEIPMLRGGKRFFHMLHKYRSCVMENMDDDFRARNVPAG